MSVFPSMLAEVGEALLHEDAARAWEKALRALATHGIVPEAPGAAEICLRVAVETCEVCFASTRDIGSQAELESLARLLRLGLVRKLDAARLQRVSERMDMLYAASFEGLLFHVDGVVIDVNARISEMSGYSHAELLGPDVVARLVAPEDQPELWRRIAEGYQGSYMITALRKDGSRFRAEMTAKQGKLGERPVRVVAVRDVTERERNEALLRESKGRLRDLAQATFDLTMLSRDGRLVDVWGAPEPMLGWTRDEMIGRPLLDFVASPARALTEQLLREERAGPYETLLLHRGGEMVPGAVVAVISTLQGVRVRLDAVRDLREELRRAAEHRLLEQQLERSQRLESLGVLAGGIAHDFNNLLVGMLGNAELLESRLTDEGDRAAATAIVAGAERAAALTAQMLAYAGRGQLGPRGPVNLSALVQELRTLLDATLSKKAQLELALISDAMVYGDRATLTQVMMNLLTNASDALGERAGVIRVRIERLQDPGERFRHALGKPVTRGDWILIEVRDNGSGMDPATLERVFEPFFTTKQKGHGLGLAACVGIVASHGGAIAVESSAGVGSCFAVLLPESKVQAAAPSLAPRDLTRRALKALIIDDQPMVRTYLRHALGRLGYDSEEAANGEAGLSRLLGEGIDLVFLDMTMPDLSGAEVLARIRARDTSLPVILISGYHDLAAQLDPRAFQAFLVKPFGITQLAKALDQATASALAPARD